MLTKEFAILLSIWQHVEKKSPYENHSKYLLAIYLQNNFLYHNVAKHLVNKVI